MRNLPPLNRFRATLLLLLLVVLVGTWGYAHISHLDAVDSLYMAVITLFTVGYRVMTAM